MENLLSKSVKAAATLLERKDYEVLDRGVGAGLHPGSGIVALDGDTLVFVGVRAREGRRAAFLRCRAPSESAPRRPLPGGLRRTATASGMSACASTSYPSSSWTREGRSRGMSSTPSARKGA